MTTPIDQSLKILSDNNLSANQGWCLVQLLRGDRNLTQLAKKTQVSTAAMTNIIDVLDGKGLTFRSDDPEDRRVKLVSLKPKGRSLAKSL